MTETEMAESAMDRDRPGEEEVEMAEEEENEENIGRSSDTSEFLRELNLVLILSFLSLSAEERLSFEEIKPKDVIKHPKPKHSGTPLHLACTREPKLNDFRALERQAHKFQPKIRDCRHSRRM